ncbi:GNAT family N-acetyltransferase [Heliobacterium gestii]|uniref:GNAT family N-acetyltransferase n=1 Tax=Heliomicrobium gestii TaxID=2699 RepID=A0A845LDJ1_HELGE|nr:GNAT family N-acetyltransferase [Heliomicrobium gestii]MBM7866720.1 RimJ/RimL family protein N-acetyltransferase [Heliomicrobium gestii]MZP43000.1 GNAT family N-acetyltransferase [Heliomicrobium gestii]
MAEAIITGRFVRLRPVEERDLERIRQWRNSPEVYYPMYNWDPITPEMQMNWYRHRVCDRERHRFFVIERILPAERATVDGMEAEEPPVTGSGTGLRPVGLISLTHMEPRHRRADLGFYIAEERDRLPGVALEAEYLLLRHGFGDLGLHKIWAEVLEGNEAVARMHRNYGFLVEGTLREHVWHDDRFKDVICLGLLPADFSATRKKIETLLKRLK